LLILKFYLHNYSEVQFVVVFFCYPVTGEESLPTERPTATEAAEDSPEPSSLQTVTENATVNRTE